jgi:pyrimidine deaminase RibD-like protein
VIINEILSVPSDDPREELDRILAKCCELVISNQKREPEHFGWVGACVVGPEGQEVCRSSYRDDDDKFVHAEVAALEAYGDVTPECIVVTTLSPCNRPMSDRAGASCEDVINSYGVEHVYCGYKDPTQDQDDSIETNNTKVRDLCKKLADVFLKENFADGKVKGKSRPGRVKRAGASCKGSVTSLRAKARRASGERARMYHWCANMKGGHKKNESALDEKWSKKYKRSIDCSHPKGFSQRAHCQGRKKK